MRERHVLTVPRTIRLVEHRVHGLRVGRLERAARVAARIGTGGFWRRRAHLVMIRRVTGDELAYLTPEARARVEIDRMLDGGRLGGAGRARP